MAKKAIVTELPLSQSEDDTLKNLLKGAEMNKGSKLTDDEQDEIVKSYTDIVKKQRQAEAEKQAAEAKAAEERNQSRLAVMMPHDRENKAKL